MDNTRENWDDVGKLILRFTIAFLLVFHGIGKLEHGIDWMKAPLAHFHLPFFVGFGVYVAEIVAPVLILVGLLTRPAALVVVFDLVMAIVLVAHARIFELTKGGSYALEAEAFFLLLGVVLFFQGAGRYSVTRGRGFWL
ncbi:MAG TPA: DoxX family protein [Spirochaetia bacterium]|nr:DoxX family protein [Spirochaetia bacterium]